MENELLQKLLLSPLFYGLTETEAGRLLEKCGEVVSFPAGASFSPAPGGQCRVGVLLVGAVTVIGENKTILNRLSPGGVFGVAALFRQGSGANTKLIASAPSKIFFLTEKEIERLTENKQIRRNLLAFLSDRIRFLNRKIATFSAPSAEGKLALYLLEREQNGTAVLDHSLVELAKALDLGRASLYRAFRLLEEKGAVLRNGKRVSIVDWDVLNKII